MHLYIHIYYILQGWHLIQDFSIHNYMVYHCILYRYFYLVCPTVGMKIWYLTKFIVASMLMNGTSSCNVFDIKLSVQSI